MEELQEKLKNLSGKNIVITGDVILNVSAVEQLAKDTQKLCLSYKESSFKLDTAAKIRKYCQDAQDYESILILAGLHITEEAEASLLKTFEERDEKITICICVPSLVSLEKTILSRSVLVRGIEAPHTFAAAFLETPAPKRIMLKEIQSLLESEDEFSKMELLSILTSAYKISLERVPNALPIATYKELLVLIEEASRPGSSLKQVVQTVCLLLPQV